MCWCFLSCVFSGNFHRVLSLLGWTLHTVEGICHLCMCQERESPYSRSIKVECHVQVRKSNLFNPFIQWKSGYFTSHCACFVSPTVVQRMPERTCELNPVAYPKVRINIHPVACSVSVFQYSQSDNFIRTVGSLLHSFVLERFRMTSLNPKML